MIQEIVVYAEHRLLISIQAELITLSTTWSF